MFSFVFFCNSEFSLLFVTLFIFILLACKKKKRKKMGGLTPKALKTTGDFFPDMNSKEAYFLLAAGPPVAGRGNGLNLASDFLLMKGR